MYEVYNTNIGCVEYRIFPTELWAEVQVWLERDYNVFVDDKRRMIIVTMREGV